MSEKKTKNKKSPYAVDGKVRIRDSYYTFSQQYPSRILPLEGKRRKGRKQRTVKKCLAVLAFIFLVCFSYCAMNVLFDISYKAPESTDSSVTESTESTEEVLSLLEEEGIRALYMPYERLGDRDYIRNLIKEVQIKNCNSVVIDFKTEEGKLIYTSMNEYAITAKAALFDNNTVRQAIDLFRAKDVNIVARVFCFRDSLSSSANPDLAVKYMNTDINWLDSSDEKGGSTWLNPLSVKARGYIRDVVSEVLSFKVDGIILEGVHFPTGENTSGATYPGEKKASARNKVLRDFVSDIKAILPKDSFLLLSQTATDILEGNEDIYFGDMLFSSADGFNVDTLGRDEKYTIDRKTDFVSIFSLFSAIKESAGEKKAVYTVHMSEYSAAYLRKMKKAGYENFILYSADGEY